MLAGGILFLCLSGIIPTTHGLQNIMKIHKKSPKPSHLYSSSGESIGDVSRRDVLVPFLGAAITSLFLPRHAEAAVSVVSTTTDKNSNSDSSSSNSFSAYSILPDAGPSLDPKLRRVSEKNLVREISKQSGSVWLGEHHNSLKDHEFQTSFIRSLFEQRKKDRIGGPMAIGLEQVQVQFQPVLDDFVAGKMSLEDMRSQVQWEKRWMWSFDGYSSIFLTAKELGIRLLALNVDSEDLSIVEKAGYPGLPSETMRKYILDPAGFGAFAKERQYSTYVKYVISPSYEMHDKLGLLQYTISGEKLDEKMPFRNFLSGRILWDEAMASSAYRWTIDNPTGLLVGLFGADHVKFRNG